MNTLEQVAPHIIKGKKESAKLKESDIKELLLEKISYIFTWKTSNSLDGWLDNIANMGGTFGEFYGWWDTGSKTRNYIEIRLSDGRVFKFRKIDLFNNRSIQGSLL